MKKGEVVLDLGAGAGFDQKLNLSREKTEDLAKSVASPKVSAVKPAAR